jgi:uncharacterized protein
MSGADEPRVVRDEHARRYEVFKGDQRAGFVSYRDEQGVRTLIHTEVDPAFKGGGLAGRLARKALDDARAEGLKVVPKCSYIAAYIEKHEEYADLVG